MKLKIADTRYHKIVNLTSLALLAGVFAFLFFCWDTLPDKIPAHYNLAGTIDRWGSRWELLACPVIAAGLYALISVVARFPQLWNTGVTVTEENRERVYLELKNLIVTMKLSIVLIFVFLTVYSCSLRPLPTWFYPAVLLVMFGPLVHFLARVYRKN